MKKPNPLVIKGRLWRIYFASLHDEDTIGKPGRITTCRVIADNAQEAINLAESAFPRETVDTLHTDHDSFSSRMPTRDTDSIVMKME